MDTNKFARELSGSQPLCWDGGTAKVGLWHPSVTDIHNLSGPVHWLYGLLRMTWINNYVQGEKIYKGLSYNRISSLRREEGSCRWKLLRRTSGAEKERLKPQTTAEVPYEENGKPHSILLSSTRRQQNRLSTRTQQDSDVHDPLKMFHGFRPARYACEWC